jgi:hypothetical protein
MTRNVTIKLETIHINLSPYGFNHYPEEYLAVARSIEVGSTFSPVPYYLYCRCLELGIKAFLSLKGVSKQELKRKTLGHDLEALLDKAEGLGFSKLVLLSPDEKVEISKANKYYAKKDFEYINVSKVVRGYPQLPILRVLDNIGAKIVSNLREACLNA